MTNIPEVPPYLMEDHSSKPGFWNFNIGHLLTLGTFLFGGVAMYVNILISQNIAATRLANIETISNAVPGIDRRVAILETRLDTLNMQNSNIQVNIGRLLDQVGSLREDTAAIKAQLRALDQP